jgi:hypothetical protein
MLCESQSVKLCFPTEFMQLSSSDTELQISAVAGDLLHKQDVYCAFHSVSEPRALGLLTNTAQARWLEAHRPDLVPPHNPNGTPPSDHAIATRFEAAYLPLSTLRQAYLQWPYRSFLLF